MSDFNLKIDKTTMADDHSVTSRKRVRDQLNAEIEAFLAAGGKIQQLEPNASTAMSQPLSDQYSSLLP